MRRIENKQGRTVINLADRQEQTAQQQRVALSTSDLGVRFDIENVAPYDHEPQFEASGTAVIMMLGSEKIASVRAYWNCDLDQGATNVSWFGVMLYGPLGRPYLQTFTRLKAHLTQQCETICNYVARYRLSEVEVLNPTQDQLASQVLCEHLEDTQCKVIDCRGETKTFWSEWEAAGESGVVMWAHYLALTNLVYL